MIKGFYVMHILLLLTKIMGKFPKGRVMRNSLLEKAGGF